MTVAQACDSLKGRPRLQRLKGLEMRAVERMKCNALPAKQSSGIKEEAFCLSTVTTHTVDFDAARGRRESFASVFQALAADTYALDLVIKATLQRDVSLIKLSVPPPSPF